MRPAVPGRLLRNDGLAVQRPHHVPGRTVAQPLILEGGEDARAATGQERRRVDRPAVLGDLTAEHQATEASAAELRDRLAGHHRLRHRLRGTNPTACHRQPSLLQERLGQVDRAQTVDEPADGHGRVPLVYTAIAGGVYHRPRIHGRDVRAGGGLGGDADQLAIGVHGRTAAVAAGDGGIGLDPGPAVAHTGLFGEAGDATAGEGDRLPADAGIAEDADRIAQV